VEERLALGEELSDFRCLGAGRVPNVDFEVGGLGGNATAGLNLASTECLPRPWAATPVNDEKAMPTCDTDHDDEFASFRLLLRR